jgi:hypothetical protein
MGHHHHGNPLPGRIPGALQFGFREVEAEAGIEPAANRNAFVVFNVATGLTIGGQATLETAGAWFVPMGQKWKTTVETKTQNLLL